MTFKGKPIKLTMVGEADEEYKKLSKIVSEEIKGGIKSSNNQTLLRSINQKIDFLKQNPQYGVQIQKNKIPKEYLQNQEVNNLWKINLAEAWRMIYTIRGSEIDILCIILDIFDHRNYEKRFGYKKS